MKALPLTALLGSACAALSLSACVSVPKQEPPPASAADRHQITVQETGARLDIPVAAGAFALTAQQRDQLSGFASAYLRSGHGPIVLSVPGGGGNADSAARISHEMRMRLTEAGVPYAAIAGSTYDGSQSEAPIVLSFTHFEATAPECAPLWRQDLAHQSNNQAYESFGCSAQANLAAMIEDPRDLMQPRDETARDGARRAEVMEHYRAGEQTHAERSSDERVSISSAVR
ncbi:MAG: CpaD family pilus assembly protein [Caulobacterales bacterium]